MPAESPSRDAAHAPRKAWLSTLAKSAEGAPAAAFEGDLPAHAVLRPAEIGSVMVRGRAGGTGAAFNLGEMTVTRATVRLTTGEVGHGYVQGRRKADALAAACLDALMQQGDDHAAQAIAAMGAAHADAAATRAAKAAATKVDFFTMTRGDG
ncbi:MAG: phosphonate C-P lyase system protein PhnG [Shimia sp.]